jgi:PAS domain S-box-containing protein
MSSDTGQGMQTFIGRDAPILDSEGRVDRIVSIAVDITERRRAQDALKLSEANYRTLIENMDAIVGLKDASGRYVVVNRAFCLAAGLPQEDIIGKTAAEIYDDPAQVSRIESQDREVFKSLRPSRFELRNGDALIAHKAPILDGDGNVSGIVGIGMDVSNLRAAEEELRKAHALHRSLVDSLQDAVALKDASGRFLLVNQAFADQTGLPKEEIEGRLREEFLLDPELVEAARQQHEAVVGTGNSAESETSADFGIGLRSYYSRDTPILDQDGRVVRIVSVAQDVTERKRLESELRQSQKMQAGGIAHDFNNLLTVISAYAAMSEQALSSDHSAAPFQRGILDAVDRAAELIRQLLLFSSRDTANLEVVDVNSLIIGGADMLRRLIGTNIDLVMVPAHAPLLIEVDPSQFEQVLVNLAVNARDAMPGGGKLTVALGPHTIDNHADDPVLPPGQYVKLSINDDGLGMADEVRNRVFEPFFTTKETGRGSGLGLSTCFGITKQNGGDIRVTTALGDGTTFDVYLPISDKPAALSADAPPASEPPAGKETILLAEDESIVRDIVATALGDQGYTVVEASNGEEALRAAAAHDGKVHLVLTDMVMPRMGGTELVRRVQERWPGTPILLMSGYTGEERMSDTTPLLNKPFVIGELLSKVRKVLDGAGESPPA